MSTIQITDAGVALMAAAESPIVLTSYSLGSDFGYVPTGSDTGIHGSPVYTGTPGAPDIKTANIVLYPIEVPAPAGTFQFGEVGLFYGSTLFALLVLDELVTKAPRTDSPPAGGAITIDVFCPMLGNNYQLWANVSQSNTNKISVLGGPEELPYSVNAIPNVFIVQALGAFKSFLAYTDRMGLWTFDSWNPVGDSSVLAASSTSITISSADWAAVTYAGSGSAMIEMTTGGAAAAVRYVTSAMTDGSGHVVLSLNAPLARVPLSSDGVRFFQPSTTGGDSAPPLPFPLARTEGLDSSPYFNTIAWTDTPGAFPDVGDTRIRGTINSNPYFNAATMLCETWVPVSPYADGNFPGFAVAWETYPLQRGSTSIWDAWTHIPNLQADQITGLPLVQTFSLGNATGFTRVTNDNAVTLSKDNPHLTGYGTAITTSELYLTLDSHGNPFAFNVTQGAGQTFRTKILGRFTSSSPTTLTLKLKYGTTGTVADTTIASFAITTAGSGTNIPFEIEFATAIELISAQLHLVSNCRALNQGTTGLTTSIYTGFAPVDYGGSLPVGTHYLGLSAQNAGGGNTMTVDLITLEEVT